jgi:hypothetical protein
MTSAAVGTTSPLTCEPIALLAMLATRIPSERIAYCAFRSGVLDEVVLKPVIGAMARPPATNSGRGP